MSFKYLILMNYQAYYSVTAFSLVVIVVSTLMFINVYSFRKNIRAIAIPFFACLSIIIEMVGTALVSFDQKMVASILLGLYFTSGGFTGWSIVIAFDVFAKTNVFKERWKRLLLAIPAFAFIPFYIYDLVTKGFALNVFSVEYSASGMASTVVLALYLVGNGVFGFLAARKVVGSRKILCMAFGLCSLIPFIFMAIGFITLQGMEYRWFPYAMMVLIAVLFLLCHKITQDGLTGIKNRSAFDDDIKEKVNNASKYKAVYLMYCDIDDFKAINDNYGHSVGDEALSFFGKALHEEADAIHANAFRMGGDEFSVIFCRQSMKEIDNFIKRICERAEKTEFTFNLKFSFGIAKYVEGMSVIDFLNLADREMYEQKRKSEATRN
ncbi:MAG: GGDEF domain-containing protein [Bacilli bacterium]|nr:GGDEF domain-containing protein [Bacilli bacterium]